MRRGFGAARARRQSRRRPERFFRRTAAGKPLAGRALAARFRRSRSSRSARTLTVDIPGVRARRPHSTTPGRATILKVRRAPTLFLILALALYSLLASSGHAQESTPKLRGKLTVSGAATLFPLVNDIALRYEHLYPGVRIDVRSVGSGNGVADVRSGAADIGMLSRALLGNERDLFSYPVARGGVAVVVHRDNP